VYDRVPDSRRSGVGAEVGHVIVWYDFKASDWSKLDSCSYRELVAAPPGRWGSSTVI
jgi:hypothetical protein